MNIWLLTSEYPPDFGGGITTYVDHVAKMLTSAGHSVTVFSRAENETNIEQVNDNLRIVRFQHLQGEVYQTMGYWAALSYQFSQVVIDQIVADGTKPDIIEFQEYNAIGYYLLQRKLCGEKELQGIPTLCHLHTPTFELTRINKIPQYVFPNYWIGRMEKFCINASTSVISPSYFLKNEVEPHVAENVEIDVLYHCFSMNQEDVANAYDKSFDYVYTGRLEYRKGVLEFLAGVKEFWDKGEKFTVAMVGGDTYFAPKACTVGEIIRNKFGEYIADGRLSLIDRLPRHELFSVIKNSRISVVPSLYENFPFVCVEHMHLGQAMLVAKSGGQAEMVGDDESCGFVFDWSADGDFARQFEKSLRLSDEQVEQKGQASYKRINELCSYENNIKRREELFEKVIAKETVLDEFPIYNPFSRKQLTSGSSAKPGLLSIIIPFYNLAEYLEETLESALLSDYENSEIIIVNDGSSDPDSIALLEDIRSRDISNLKIIDIENGGLANARNVGALNSEAEFITFLDADDKIDPSFFSKSVKILNQYKNISFVYSWLQYFEGSDGKWVTFNTELPYILGANMLSAFTVVRRESFIESGLNRKEMEFGLEDYDGWVKMVCNGHLGVSIPEALVNYRIREKSMLRSVNNDTRLYLLEQLSSNYPEAYEKFGQELFNLMAANGPGYLWNNPTFEHAPVSYQQEGVVEVVETATEYYLSAAVKNAELVETSFPMNYHIDSFDQEKMLIRGWGFLTMYPSKDTECFLVFKKGRSTYSFKLYKEKRKDVAAHYNNELYSDSGFSSQLCLKDLKPGTYEAFLQVKSRGRSAFRSIGETVTVKKLQEIKLCVAVSGKKPTKSLGREVWLKKIEGKHQGVVSELDLSKQGAWSSQYGYMVSSGSEDDRLLWRGREETVVLTFMTSPYSGSVEVAFGKEKEVIDLYSEEEGELVRKVPSK